MTRLLPAVGLALAGSLTCAAAQEPPAPSPSLSEADDAPPSPRELRRARRAERWAGPVLPPEADFLRTHTEVTVRFAFNGTSPGPFSLFTALAGWNEIGVGLERGLATWRDFTVALGVEGHYGGAWVPAALAQRISDTEDVRFRWQAWEAGGALRVAFHYTRLASVDPWIGGAVGASAFHLGVRVADPPGPAPQSLTLPYLRGELAAGLNLPLRHGLIVGVEVRYLVTGLLSRVQRLRFALPDDDVETFVLFPQHRPPKGFSWVVRFGYRF